jgi:hypothetical protein
VAISYTIQGDHKSSRYAGGSKIILLYTLGQKSLYCTGWTVSRALQVGRKSPYALYYVDISSNNNNNNNNNIKFDKPINNTVLDSECTI